MYPSRPEHFDIDLGLDHLLCFVAWRPDRALNPQYDGMPDVDKYGATVYHKRASGIWCAGAVHFAGVGGPPSKVTWDVVSWEPLTLSPSLLCKGPVFVDGTWDRKTTCGDHGFIREGRWVVA